MFHYFLYFTCLTSTQLQAENQRCNFMILLIDKLNIFNLFIFISQISTPFSRIKIILKSLIRKVSQIRWLLIYLSERMAENSPIVIPYVSQFYLTSTAIFFARLPSHRTFSLLLLPFSLSCYLVNFLSPPFHADIRICPLLYLAFQFDDHKRPRKCSNALKTLEFLSIRLV